MEQNASDAKRKIIVLQGSYLYAMGLRVFDVGRYDFDELLSMVKDEVGGNGALYGKPVYITNNRSESFRNAISIAGFFVQFVDTAKNEEEGQAIIEILNNAGINKASTAVVATNNADVLQWMRDQDFADVVETYIIGTTQLNKKIGKPFSDMEKITQIANVKFIEIAEFIPRLKLEAVMERTPTIQKVIQPATPALVPSAPVAPQTEVSQTTTISTPPPSVHEMQIRMNLRFTGDIACVTDLIKKVTHMIKNGTYRNARIKIECTDLTEI